jgi:DNA-binding CsgD family transcriptional regulator/PAS domain-containing protein
VILFGNAGNAALRGGYSEGFDPRFFEELRVHYGAINPWNKFWAEVMPFRAAVSDDAMPSSLFKNTEFYNDWLMRIGGMESAVGMKLSAGGDGFGCIALHYDSRRAARYNVDLAYVLRNLTATIRNSIEVNRKLLSETSTPASLDVVIEALDDPTFVVDDSSRIRLQNAAAAEMLRESKLVRTGGDGRLVFSDYDANARLGGALSAARSLETSETEELPSTFPIRSETGCVEGFVKVLIIPAAGTTSLLVGRLLPPVRYGLITVRRKSRRPSDMTTLQSVFGMTNAEARLALRLEQGETLGGIADEFGLSRETLRRQLKSIFSKTYTSRQAELVLLLSRLP